MDATPVDRLQKQLEHHRRIGHIDSATRERLRNRIARHVLAALRDEGHPLTEQVQQLEQLAKQLPEPVPDPDAEAGNEGTKNKDKKGAPAKPRPWPDLLFTPRPGIGVIALRRFWPVQLLLNETAASGHSTALALLRGLGVEQVKEAFDRVNPHSVEYWSTTQYLDCLIEALNLLSAPVLAPTELDGRHLRYGEREVRLSPQEARTFQLLEAHTGQPVAYRTMRDEARVTDPRKVKCNLMKKAEEAGIPLNITAPVPGYYQLEA
ncbi:MAG: hypothetical protein ACOC9Q_02835 [bacterium]